MKCLTYLHIKPIVSDTPAFSIVFYRRRFLIYTCLYHNLSHLKWPINNKQTSFLYPVYRSKSSPVNGKMILWISKAGSVDHRSSCLNYFIGCHLT